MLQRDLQDRSKIAILLSLWKKILSDRAQLYAEEVVDDQNFLQESWSAFQSIFSTLIDPSEKCLEANK